jgi:nitronate monooxygenase
MVTMALSTAFTEMFGIRHPIALAPMGGSAGGALAAAVSNGGGLGLLGGGPGDRDWLSRELPLVAEATTKPWGIGFQTWAVDPAVVESALQHAPAALMLSFGDPRPFTRLVRQAGVPLIIQVTDLAETRQVLSRSRPVGTADVDALVDRQDQINVCRFGRYSDRNDKHFE